MKSAARIARLLGLILLGTTIANAAAFDLVTPAEYAASRDAIPPEQEFRKSTANTSEPGIEIVSPDLTKAAKAPIDIRVRFAAVPPATIDPESFRVFYGVLRIDITDRIRKAARITADGVDAQGAALPVGMHRLTMVVADSAGRSAERSIRLAVE